MSHSVTAMDTAGFVDGYICSCGRSFPGPGPLNFHKRSCRSSKKRLHGALARAKELWQERKKPRLDLKESEGPGSSQESDDRVNDPTPCAANMERDQSVETVRDLRSVQSLCITSSNFIPSRKASMTFSPLCVFLTRYVLLMHLHLNANVILAEIQNPQIPTDDGSLSLAERRPRRLNRLLPKRFRDVLPQPQPPLLPSSMFWSLILHCHY